MVGPKQTGSEKKRRCRKTERMEGKFRGSADLGRLIAIRMEAPSRVLNFGRQAGKPQPEQSKHLGPMSTVWEGVRGSHCPGSPTMAR